MTASVLVIGGGVTGIQAALDLAEAGAEVHLVERGASTGGMMAQLDKTFPTLDCSTCIEAPKMSAAFRNKNITFHTLSEVDAIEGAPGKFKVRLKAHTRFVTNGCTACGDCVRACPVIVPNEYDASLKTRRAIYQPFPQAVPSTYAVDLEHCLNEPNVLACNLCYEACGPKAIDWNQLAEGTSELTVGAVVVATGVEPFDASKLPEFGYGKYKDVLTSLELERMLSASGVTGGKVVRPSDRKAPGDVTIVLCAGSRDQRACEYCSRVCCTYSLKHAVQLLEHGAAKHVRVLFMDIRAYGRGFDDFYTRAAARGAEFVRSRAGGVIERGGKLFVRFEDTREGRFREVPTDLVVLATALVPPQGTEHLAHTLGIELGPDGFFRGGVGGDPVASTRPGVLLAGGASGPKDIPDCVSEAGAASARALALATDRLPPAPEPPETVKLDGEARVGVFVCHCGSNIAKTVDCGKVKDFAKGLPNVVLAEENMFSCSANTLTSITGKIKEHNLTRVVVAACSPRTHEPTFRAACKEAGLNEFLFEMANIRDQNSWVHRDRAEATTKAEDLTWMAVEKARRLERLDRLGAQCTRRALVVGSGPAGLSAAAAIARQGIETHLVEKDRDPGGRLLKLHDLAPEGTLARTLLEGQLKDAIDAGVQMHLADEIESVGGFVGNFRVNLKKGAKLDVGSIVLATGSRLYKPTEFGYGADPRVLTNADLEQVKDKVVGKRVTFVACVGSRSAERPWCSRYCCESMVHQARELKRQGNHVRVLYREMRTFSRGAEEAYRKAGEEGVFFLRFAPLRPPVFEGGKVRVFDELLGDEVEMDTDLLVLEAGLEPPDMALAEMLKVPRGMDGFILELHPKLGPVETAVAGVYLAGSAQSPHRVEESIIAGSAAGAKVGGLLSHDEVSLEPLAPLVDEATCTGCTACTLVCPFGAIHMVPHEGKPKGVAHIEPAICQGCGTCVAACPPSSIDQPHFRDAQVESQIDAALARDPEGKVLVFACNWCSYAGADLAGISRREYPSSARVIRTMCSGRVSDKLVFRAFARGAGAVLVTGCHPGDCHYISANTQTAKRVPKWVQRLQRKGVAPERLQLWWVSAAEGERFASKVEEMHKVLGALKPGEVEATRKALKEFGGFDT